MKTTEERADEYVGHPQEIGEDLSVTMTREAYIQGAKEQKQIDIDKAKSAFESVCGWLSTYSWYSAVLNEFIKELEE